MKLRQRAKEQNTERTAEAAERRERELKGQRATVVSAANRALDYAADDPERIRSEELEVWLPSANKTRPIWLFHREGLTFLGTTHWDRHESGYICVRLRKGAEPDWDWARDGNNNGNAIANTRYAPDGWGAVYSPGELDERLHGGVLVEAEGIVDLTLWQRLGRYLTRNHHEED